MKEEVLSQSVSYIAVMILIIFDPLGPHSFPKNEFIKQFCIWNNIYQIIVHFILGILFFVNSRYKNYIPGAHDRQSTLHFNIFTTIDFLGWVTLGLYSGIWNYFIRFLAYKHLSTGLVSFVDHINFQQTFINLNKTNISKGIFVLTDSIVRSYMLYVTFKKLSFF